ncbi:hypothetical protein [Lysinibacter cavernae]|uniref:Outer membrane murein-binding lipoprotein Lpp n=1 Tax=Lysinibacter cavernae TaxID=1640652 RepID=A0A7X5R2K7_9MICO|nr:hypothetical protein [Lysinibacter cavernae]NIH54401.1 outer membrane murein-binding lipoprotein Lpp [Lysinibacter cavernae]
MKSFTTFARTSSIAAVLVGGLLLTGCTGSNSALPEGVPADVKAVSGEVTNVASSSDSNWSFSVEVADENAQNDAVKKLTDAGFRVVGENEADGAKTYALTNDKVNVTIVLTQIEKQRVVVYNIVKL